MLQEIKTYRDLLKALQKLTPGQLKQPIQIMPSSPFPIKELQPALAIGTIDKLEVYGSRSSIDNRYHPEEVVILADGNPFGEDGAIAYECVGMRKGKMQRKPIYGDAGPTSKKSQLRPNPIDEDKEISQELRLILKNRMKSVGPDKVSKALEKGKKK